MKTITTKTQIEDYPCSDCGTPFRQPVKVTTSIYNPNLTLRVPAFLNCPDCAVDNADNGPLKPVTCFECGAASSLLDSDGICPECGCGG